MNIHGKIEHKLQIKYYNSVQHIPGEDQEVGYDVGAFEKQKKKPGICPAGSSPDLDTKQH